MSKDTLFDLDEGDEVPDLYALLEVPRDATDEDLRKAYRKRALRTHPDKWAHLDPTSPEAKAKTCEFQQIGFAYTVLKDPKRRKVYDATGSLSDDIIEEEKDWDAYFRQLWTGVVDATTIEQFSKTYKGSSEEHGDILAAYRLHDGDLDLIFTEVMLAEVEDEPRFIKVIEDAIKAKSVKRTKKYTKSKRGSEQRKREAAKEAAEAEALRKELGLDDQLRKIKADKQKKKRKHGDDSDDDDQGAITALIRQRSTGRMNAIISNIEQKYAKPKAASKKKGKHAAAEEFVEPSEEEFLALQAKMFSKK
ncbi:hypothetical protein H4S07_006373 [Coemansia furcata]|uniref:Uncharacterized protein n=1 Tax=Coemansia furcata TaxID=417177 RepID=A0ACC1KVG9_9FUNG|nr:hypothetical protein H4S07_006373 [Coemansia furcata]